MDSIDGKKTRGRKSRATVLLINHVRVQCSTDQGIMGTKLRCVKRIQYGHQYTVRKYRFVDVQYISRYIHVLIKQMFLQYV